MIPGTPERRSFDYIRHGTIDLFAALNTATGKVIGHLSAQHRAVDFRDFLDQIDRKTEPGLVVMVTDLNHMCTVGHLNRPLSFMFRRNSLKQCQARPDNGIRPVPALWAGIGPREGKTPVPVPRLS